MHVALSSSSSSSCRASSNPSNSSWSLLGSLDLQGLVAGGQGSSRARECLLDPRTKALGLSSRKQIRGGQVHHCLRMRNLLARSSVVLARLSQQQVDRPPPICNSLALQVQDHGRISKASKGLHSSQDSNTVAPGHSSNSSRLRGSSSNNIRPGVRQGNSSSSRHGMDQGSSSSRHGMDWDSSRTTISRVHTSNREHTRSRADRASMVLGMGDRRRPCQHNNSRGQHHRLACKGATSNSSSSSGSSKTGSNRTVSHNSSNIGAASQASSTQHSRDPGKVPNRTSSSSKGMCSTSSHTHNCHHNSSSHRSSSKEDVHPCLTNPQQHRCNPVRLLQCSLSHSNRHSSNQDRWFAHKQCLHSLHKRLQLQHPWPQRHPKCHQTLRAALQKQLLQQVAAPCLYRPHSCLRSCAATLRSWGSSPLLFSSRPTGPQEHAILATIGPPCSCQMLTGLVVMERALGLGLTVEAQGWCQGTA